MGPDGKHFGIIVCKLVGSPRDYLAQLASLDSHSLGQLFSALSLTYQALHGPLFVHYYSATIIE